MRALRYPAGRSGAVAGAGFASSVLPGAFSTRKKLTSDSWNTSERVAGLHAASAVAERVGAWDGTAAAAAAAAVAPVMPPATPSRRRRVTYTQRPDLTYPKPWSLLHAEVQAAVKQRQLLQRGAHVMVAVSGGQDSLCLAQLLLDLAPILGISLTVAHCDHRMRPDSKGCAAYVRSWAVGRGLPFCESVADRPLRGEAQAREWRYSQLAALAQAHGCTHVATGHTASDRAETLLLNLARGAGADGLAAMAWRRPLTCDSCGESDSSGNGITGGSRVPGSCIELVRPMLTVSREQTGEECARRGMQPWEDPTNADTRYSRNAVRHTVLPALRAINPAAVSHLAALAEMLSGDVECLEAAAAEALDVAATKGNGGSNNSSSTSRETVEPLDRAMLRARHISLQRRALRQWLRRGLGSAPTFDQVEETRRLVSAPNRSRGSTLRHGTWVQVDGPLLVLVGSRDCSGVRKAGY